MNENVTWAPDACTLPTAEQPFREAECCSFFTFTLSGTTELRLRITVPPTQTAVLDGLVGRLGR